MKGGFSFMAIITKENSSSIVSIIAIIAMMICCLAGLGYNSKVSIEKEKIEVTATNSNLSPNNI